MGANSNLHHGPPTAASNAANTAGDLEQAGYLLGRALARRGVWTPQERQDVQHCLDLTTLCANRARHHAVQE